MSAELPPAQFPTVISTVSAPPPLLPTTAVVAQETQIWSQRDVQGSIAHMDGKRGETEVCLQTSMKTAPCSPMPNYVPRECGPHFPSAMSCNLSSKTWHDRLVLSPVRQWVVTYLLAGLSAHSPSLWDLAPA